MLYQGNGNDSVDGVYERERLRRMAKKLGLRLVKPSVQRSEAANHSVAPGAAVQPPTQIDTRSESQRKFDKCG
jgi:hypothetical protein